MKKRSRKKKKEALVYRQVALTFIFGLVFFVFLLAFGTRGLVNLASFLGNLRSRNTPIENPNKNTSFLPPSLAALPIATNSAQISVQGFGQSGTTIEVFLNDVLAESVLVTKEGKFEASGITLDQEKNKIYAFTKTDDKRSEKSRTIWVNFKKEPPELEITSPSGQTTVSGEEEKILIQGKTDPETSLTIDERWVIVKKDGSFSYEFPLFEGENEIKVTARDTAGNQTEKTISIKYQP